MENAGFHSKDQKKNELLWLSKTQSKVFAYKQKILYGDAFENQKKNINYNNNINNILENNVEN